MVHQHFMLADQLTVLENVVLGSAPRRSTPSWFRAAAGVVALLIVLAAFVVDGLSESAWPLLLVATVVVGFAFSRIAALVPGLVFGIALIRVAFSAEGDGLWFFDGGLSGGFWPVPMIIVGLAAHRRFGSVGLAVIERPDSGDSPGRGSDIAALGQPRHPA